MGQVHKTREESFVCGGGGGGMGHCAQNTAGTPLSKITPCFHGGRINFGSV